MSTQLAGAYEGKRVGVIASGPSLTREDALLLKSRCVVIAVNNSVELLPEADILYASDMRWWRNNEEIWKPFQGLKITRQMQGPFRKEDRVHRLPYSNSSGVSKTQLRLGRNSGHAAISLAYYLGASEIILLGFDMTVRNGVHWHGPHKKGPNPTELSMRNWQSYFKQTARACRKLNFPVYNCTRVTELEGFDRLSLEELLK
ncbi:MAG: hypothetical protein EOM24_02970 [Chloroflexia bacterium]|nr:hypothetical protein [Chloroflexia bacterium]